MRRGFVNLPRIKGSHNAMLSGMLAAEHVAAALAQGARTTSSSDYEDAWRGSPIGRDLYKVRNVKPLWSRFGTCSGSRLGGFDMWTNSLGLLAFRHAQHGKPDAATLKPAARCQPIAYPKPDGKLTFDRLSSVFLSNTNHEEDQPPISRSPTRRLQKRSEHDVYAGPSARYCPAGVYEWVEEGGNARVRDQRAKLRPLQNLRHQGPDGNINWVPPEGGGGQIIRTCREKATRLPGYWEVRHDIAVRRAGAKQMAADQERPWTALREGWQSPGFSEVRSTMAGVC